MKIVLVLLLIALFTTGALTQDGLHLIAPFNEELPLRDLAVSCGNGVYLFGDTFSAINGLGWRPNTGARLVNGNLTPLNNDQVLWVADPDTEAAAQALTPPQHGQSVPSSCIEINGVLYAWYTDAASNRGHDFQAVNAGVAVSWDNGATWAKVRLFEGDTSYTQAMFASVEGGYLYMLMSGAGRVGSATLARTPAMTDPSAYEWFDGAVWGPLQNAVPVITGQVGEGSVCYDGQAWQALYLDPSYNGIVLRSAPSLEGAWDAPNVVLSWDRVHGVYAPEWAECGRRFLLSHFERVNVDGQDLPAYQVYVWGWQ